MPSNSALVSDVCAQALRAFYNAPQRDHPAHYRADLAAVFALAAAGVVQPLIDRIFELAEASAAHTRMNEGHHTGKIVLRIEG